MKIVTWNCCRGPRAAKLAALGRLSPDVAVVPECARPGVPGGRRDAWFGNNPRQGVAILAANGFEVEALPFTGPASAYAARVAGPTPFHLLAVWAQRAPTYARAVLDALKAHRSFLLERPSVVTGDFNTSTTMAPRARSGTHADIVRMLEEELGLVSAYHHFFKEKHGGEKRPTHYFKWDKARPFHIDYCFVPRPWLVRVQNVEVGSYADWAEESDHRPLVVDVF